jgi:hypothetical protein
LLSCGFGEGGLRFGLGVAFEVAGVLGVQLAFADCDPDRAALLEGAADGLRRRVGLPAWPHLRQVEGDLVARARHRLGGSRFDQVFSAGSGLTQREAVAIVRDQRGTPAP